MNNKIIAVLFSGIILLGSCSKRGDTGPQGPAGYDGNANVIDAGSITVDQTQWSQQGAYWKTGLLIDQITQDVVNSGVVEVYKQYSTGVGTSWTNLPDVIGINSTVFNFYLGGLDIYNQNSDGTLPANPGSVTFRVVVIPSSLRKANPNTNWNNYNEVLPFLNKNAVKATMVTAKQ